MGRNGVGKTTLLQDDHGPAAGPRRAASSLDGQRHHALVARPPGARRASATCRRGARSSRTSRVEENLRMALLGCERATSHRRRARRSSRRSGSCSARKGGVLSGGEQQMLAIGRALLTRPKLLMLDEPTEGIQPSIIQEIEEAIRRIKTESGVAVLLVEQYLDFAERLADALRDPGQGRRGGGRRDARTRTSRWSSTTSPSETGSNGSDDAPHPARAGKAPDLHRGRAGPPPAGARPQAQPSRGAGPHHRRDRWRASATAAASPS